MVIRTFENRMNKKGVLIHEDHKCFFLVLYDCGDFKGTKKYKRFKKAQRAALRFINK